MLRIASIVFIVAVLFALQLFCVQGFVVVVVGNIHSRHVPSPLPQSFDIVTKNMYTKYEILQGIHFTPVRRCDSTLKAFIGDVSSSSSSDTTTLYLSQMPQFPQLPTPPTTIDPTTILSDIFSTVLGTPLILAIPIVAALLVATLIAYLIVSYASPAEEE